VTDDGETATSDPPESVGDGASKPVIVVGVDGSEPSKHALAWAAEEARLRGASLRVVTAWHIPTVIYPSDIDSYATEPEAARVRLDGEIAEILGPHPDITVSRIVDVGPAARLILQHAEDASLVVVGWRGHGGFGGLLLGATSSQIAHHATCPVTIVRP